MKAIWFISTMLCLLTEGSMSPASEKKHFSDLTDNAVRSDEAVDSMGAGIVESARISSSYAIRNGRYDEAVRLTRESLKKNYDDMELHKLYAEALEGKLHISHNEDPQLFNECVKEWLIVLRNEVGEEKGNSYHGISIMGHLFEDEEQSLKARTHLIDLTGKAPKPWETNAKYLRRVLKRETVKGRVLQK
jgi:hypothetical protein